MNFGDCYNPGYLERFFNIPVSSTAFSSKLTVLLACVVFAFPLVAFPQTTPQIAGNSTSSNDDWVRVFSDDGEFSVEVPTLYSFFADAAGFQVSQGTDSDLALTNMYTLSAVHNGTLVSFEVYDGKKKERALDILYDLDAFDNKGRKVTTVNFGDLKIKQVTNRTDKYFGIRQFFFTKKHIYILTTAARDGETPDMRRFLDSLRINENSDPIGDNSVSFRTMKLYQLLIKVEDPPKNNPKSPPASLQPDPTVKPLVMIRMTRSSYIQQARDNGVSGDIRLRLKVNDNGAVDEVMIVRSLPAGLLRQAVLAALRTKVLPREKDGNPLPSIITVEFGFSIH